MTDEQKTELGKALRIDIDKVPEAVSIVAISPDAAESMGLNSNEVNLLPALIVT